MEELVKTTEKKEVEEEFSLKNVCFSIYDAKLTLNIQILHQDCLNSKHEKF